MSKALLISRNSMRIHFENWFRDTYAKNQKDKILSIAEMCMDSPVLARLKNIVIRKPLRYGMDKLKEVLMRPKVISRGLHAIAHSLTDSTMYAFFIWKVSCREHLLQQRIRTLTNGKRITGGAMKIQKIARRKRREVLKTFYDHREH